MKTVLAVLAGTLAVSAPAWASMWDWSCDQKAPRDASVSATGARKVRVLAGAGDLKIHGGSGASVSVHGTACASSEERLAGIKLVAERRGDVVHIEAVIPDDWSNGARHLDLDIEGPASIALDVDDGSGSAQVRGVGSLQIEDGSGDLEIDGVRGPVTVDDGSGTLSIANVDGQVRIKDGSGEIVVHDVASVLIDEDGSGGVELSHVRGNVVIRDDGSGSISVADVAGDFTVDSDGSGGIDHRDVRGRVKIPSDK